MAGSIENVSRAVASMLREGPGTLAYNQAIRYHGLLIDQFSYRDDLAVAIDAVAGNRQDYYSCYNAIQHDIYRVYSLFRLFHHIVDDEKVANAILDRMDLENLPRDSQFYSLRNLRRKTIGESVIDVSVTMVSQSNSFLIEFFLFRTQGAAPLMTFFDFPEGNLRARLAVEQVFGKWLLCRDLEAARKISAERSIDCVTLQGHRVCALALCSLSVA